MVCIEASPRKNKPFPARRYPMFSQQGYLWKATVTKRESKKILLALQLDRMWYRVFDVKYDRSSNYRQAFLRANPAHNGTYRCVYCGRQIPVSKMTVDHVIPVSAAKSFPRARRRLHGRGVNDLRNLVPCCASCNEQKLDSLDIKWSIKATIGKYRLYWALRKIIPCLMIIWFIYMCTAGSWAQHLSFLRGNRWYDILLGIVTRMQTFLSETMAVLFS